jgi:hypothetical protein
MYVYHFLQMYSGFLLQVIVPPQSTRAVYDSLNLPGTLHFPHLHTLVISSFVKVPYLLRVIFSMILEGCLSVSSWHCFWVSVRDWGKHLSLRVICYASRLKDMEFMRLWNTFSKIKTHLKH